MSVSDARPTRRTKRERGQTILLVAVSLVTLLGLAALAIDVVTLYMARAEAQRAADAAALAGAKMLVDTGLTTDPCNTALMNAAQTLAQNQAQFVAQQNLVAGQAPLATTTFNNGAATSCAGLTPAAFGINPQVKVVVTRSGLPTFFARVWNQALATVSATAVAEAYNPSNSAPLSANASVLPIAPRCVKPMLLPNCDPLSGHLNNPGSPCGAAFPTFIDATTGAITNPGLSPAGVIGEQLTFPNGMNQITAACQGFTPSCTPLASVTPGRYYPITLPATALHLCSGCATSTTGGFQSDLECCNASTLACGQQATVDYTVNPKGAGGPAANGGQCLIHQSPGNGQDSIDTLTQSPAMFIAGDNNPFVGTSIQAGDHILTSDSVISVPLYDGVGVPGQGGTSLTVTVIGYLQLFINDVRSNGSLDVVVLNVSGCGNAPTGTAVQGAATSVPVRLIQTQ